MFERSVEASHKCGFVWLFEWLGTTLGRKRVVKC